MTTLIDRIKKALPGLVIILSIATSMFIFFGFIVFCFVYVPSRTLNTSSQDLGLYGDFIGGVVGTVIALASLGVTIYLAITLHRIEKENASLAINAQRSIAIMQFKFQEFTLFKSQCDDAFEVWKDVTDTTGQIQKAEKIINSAIDRINVLFPELKSQPEIWKIEFSILSFLVMRAKDLNAPIKNKFGYVDYDILNEDLLSQLYQNYDQAKESYLKLTKKLSQWALA